MKEAGALKVKTDEIGLALGYANYEAIQVSMQLLWFAL